MSSSEFEWCDHIRDKPAVARSPSTWRLIHDPAPHLPYQPGQHRPSPNRQGNWRNSINFLMRARNTLQDSEPELLADSSLLLIDDYSDYEEEIEGLPYEEGLFNPHSNPDGHRKYSNKFLRAVSKSMKNELNERRRKVPYPTEMLPYEPDQYSPSNPEGNKRYSIKFLKAVAEMVIPDEQLPQFWHLLAGRSMSTQDLPLRKSKSWRRPKPYDDSNDSEMLTSKIELVTVSEPSLSRLESDEDPQH